MTKDVFRLLLLILFQNIVNSQFLTPELDFHAVVITKEYFEPRNFCNEKESNIEKNTTDKLLKLRKQLQLEKLSAYIILSNDEHQSEAVSEHDKRLRYISGFSGSAGTAVVTLNSAALWTDSRYYAQAEEELDCNWILMKTGNPSTPKIEDWIISQLRKGDSVSSDPKICAYEKWILWKNKIEKANMTMKMLRDNLIDRIWNGSNGRPPKLNRPLLVLDVKFTGNPHVTNEQNIARLTWQEKFALFRGHMNKAGVDTFVITALDEIAWILNLRGSDVLYFPVFYSYLVIQMNKAVLYIPKEKITPEIIRHLKPNCTENGESVEIRGYTDIWKELPKIGQMSKKTGLPSKFSYFSGISYQIYCSIPEEKIVLMTSPALIMKAFKNPVEVAGMKASHIRDGLVVCQFLALLEEDITTGSRNWTEIEAAEYINELRKKQKYNVGISFGTIAAFGKNAANPHYQPTPETNAVIDKSQLFMLDSGGHYYDGTTDCTRTTHYGTPTSLEKELYTRLLIGCINLASVVFKEGYGLKELEILIRAPLFEMGLDYGHGSTHGIGSFLAVHEAFNTTYHENFFGSQEPGYYEDNMFGMRLENIVRVVKAPTVANKASFFTFETITMIPYERKLIDTSLLDKKHINWINYYHEQVRKLVGDEMLRQGLKREYKWLLRKTEPLKCS